MTYERSAYLKQSTWDWSTDIHRLVMFKCRKTPIPPEAIDDICANVMLKLKNVDFPQNCRGWQDGNTKHALSYMHTAIANALNDYKKKEAKERQVFNRYEDVAVAAKNMAETPCDFSYFTSDELQKIFMGLSPREQAIFVDITEGRNVTYCRKVYGRAMVNLFFERMRGIFLTAAANLERIDEFVDRQPS